MHITYLSIFPELFDSFRETTLISRAVNNHKIAFETINPRHFCDDKHRIVDDQLYGGGHGLLMKAPPIIAGIRHWIEKHGLDRAASSKQQATSNLEFKIQNSKFLIIIPHPSQDVFNQGCAHDRSECSHLLFICGRYEGIDERVRLWLQKEFPDQCVRISLGQFVTLGGEVPAMTMTEAIVRLVPGVINTEMSWIDESYSREHAFQNLEHPQYTRPELVEGMAVPSILLSGHHKNIEEWKKEKSGRVEEKKGRREEE